MTIAINATITATATKTARKQYYIRYYRDFANTFELGWTNTAAEAATAENEGWERITLDFAKAKASNARWEKRINGYCFGAQYILPIKRGEAHYNPYEMVQKGYIMDYAR